MAGGGNGTDRHSECASGVPPFGNPFRSAGTCSTETVAHSEIALFGAKPSGTVAAGRSRRQPELKCFLRASTRVKIRPQLAHTVAYRLLSPVHTEMPPQPRNYVGHFGQRSHAA